MRKQSTWRKVEVLPICSFLAASVLMPLQLKAANENNVFITKSVTQQKIKVKGNVKDQTGEPVIGANVVLKSDPTTGVSTDYDGNFEIEVPEGSILQVSYIGFIPKDVVAKKGTRLNVVISEDTKNLEEVVVIGYGSLDKKEVTSSITSIKNKDLIPGMSSSPLMAMQGKVSGLSVVSSNGTDPNAGVSVQLRGANSVNASQGPLVVVDGVPGGNLNTIAREDIQSIDVLKDASAAAIYGTRASGGVILVTTKRATEGKTQINYTGEFSLESTRRRAETLTADEFVANGLGDDLGYRTDWYDEVTREAPFTQRHAISMAGGSKSARVYASAYYKNAEGIAIGSNRREIGGRVNFIYTAFKDHLELSGNINYADIDAHKTNNGIFNMALKLNPTETPYDAEDVTGYNVWTGGWEYYNPVADINLRKDQGKENLLLANFQAKVNITSELNTSLMVAAKNNKYHDIYWRSAQHKDSRETGIRGYASQAYKNYADVTLDWLVNWNKSIDSNNIKLLGGYSFQQFDGQGFDASNQDFPVDGVEGNDMNSGSFLTDGRADMGSWKSPRTRLIAFFARANYSYSDKYMFTGSLRYEGSSKFAPKNRWGWFPAVSAGWRISSESFMEDVKWLDELKVRVGYGRTGNEGFGSGKSVRMYGADTWWLSNGRWFKTYGLSHNQNLDLKWETKDEINVGVDFAFFENRLSGKFDIYNRKSNNLIYDISVSQPPAIHDKTTMNAGSLQNTGFEIELSGVAVQTKDWNYTTTVRLSHNKNTLKSLWGSQTFWDRKGFPAPGSPGSAVRLVPGEDIGRYYIWKFAGFTEDGEWLLYDKNNEIIPASKKTNEDKRFIGNAIPKLMMSWENNISWKNFDLSLFFRGWFGYDVFNMIDMYYGLPNVKGQNVIASAYEQNKHIKGEKQLCDYFLQKGDFFKLDALTLGYTLRIPKWEEYLQSVRIYGTCRDLFTITKYKGLDPEVNINGLEPGFEELDVYPKTRTFLLGVQIAF